MRIISQDGRRDCPYDEIGLSIAWNGTGTEYNIYWHSIHKETRGKVATYSSLRKAKKAMEMLREAYSPTLVIQQQEKEIEPNIKPNDWLVGTLAQPQKVEVLDNFYFQFPADEELED